MHLFGEIVYDASGAHFCTHPNSPVKMIEKWLFELVNKYPGVTVDYYVIMPNHIHFILFVDGRTHRCAPTIDNAGKGASLPEIIKWFKTQTTNEYIRGVKAGLYPPFVKHIWQRNYYEHIIRNEQDLYEIRKYIDENPIKWEEDELFSI
jgi:REP element-mobilizing transposase RayT